MISIIIPTCEASSCLQSLLAKLEAQTVKDYELIAVDSSSEDNTIDIAESYNANVIIIRRSQFDHGATRTLAAKEAKGDIIIYLTQDALSCDGYAIENIIKPFSKDSQIAAVLEAMACGLSCMLSDIGAHREIARYSPASTKLFQVRDAHSLADKIGEVLDQDYAEMSLAAVQAVTRNLIAKTMSENHLRVYTSILREKQTLPGERRCLE